MDDFGPDTSAADFLLAIEPDAHPDLDTLFGAKADLEALLGCDVGLVEAGSVRNPCVPAGINCSRQPIHGS